MITTLEENKSIVKSAFDFTVEKFPLSGPDNLKTDLKGLFRSDNNKHVGKAVSSQYVPHQTEDVVILTEAAQHAFDDNIKVNCHFNNGHYVSIQPSQEYRRSVFGTNDNIFPRLLIDASYNGKAFKVILGYFRDLCRNLAMLNQVSGTSVSIRHNSNLPDKMDELVKQFSILKESWADLSTLIMGMDQKEVNLSEFLEQVYGMPDEDKQRAVTINKKRNNKILLRVQDEQRRSNRLVIPNINSNVTVWEAYNAVQGFVQHKSTRKEGTTDFDRILLAAKDPRVANAERLALQLASVSA